LSLAIVWRPLLTNYGCSEPEVNDGRGSAREAFALLAQHAFPAGLGRERNQLWAPAPQDRGSPR
jgi:hypothetical protein